MFQAKKEGSKKIYRWVILGKCLQDKYEKYNFIGENCKVRKNLEVCAQH